MSDTRGPLRIGIDLGGTKIEGIALGPGGAERARIRVATPRNYEATLEALAALVAELETAAGGTGPVGIGIPGTVSPETGLVKNANSTWLIGHPLDRDLEGRLGRPVRLMNDANCFALSEATDGAGAGAPVVFGVIPGPCGKRGCIETFLSGPGMSRDHREVTGRDWTTHRIVEGLEEEDPGATSAYDRYVERLARGLAAVVNVLDPHVVVLGGGMSNLPGLAERTEAALPRWVFTDQVRTRVVRNRHGDSSGVRGAAWLWPW